MIGCGVRLQPDVRCASSGSPARAPLLLEPFLLALFLLAPFRLAPFRPALFRLVLVFLPAGPRADVARAAPARRAALRPTLWRLDALRAVLFRLPALFRPPAEARFVSPASRRFLFTVAAAI